MRHRMRQVKEERPVPVFADEIHTPSRAVCRQTAWVQIVPDNPVPLVGGQVREFPLWVVWPHVMRVGEAVPLVESVLKGQEFFCISQMPFPEDGGGVVAFVEYFG